MATIRHEHVGGHVLVAAHTPDPVDQEGWEGFLERLKSTLEREGKAAILVCTSGEGGPDVTQRASLTQLGELGEVKMAVLTESNVLKGAVQALKWMAAIDAQVFAPDHEDAAIRYLEIDASHAGRALALMHQLSDRCARSRADAN